MKAIIYSGYDLKLLHKSSASINKLNYFYKVQKYVYLIHFSKKLWETKILGKLKREHFATVIT